MKVAAYIGWTVLVLVVGLSNGGSASVWLCVAALVGNLLMWAESRDKAFFGLASLGGFSLAFRYVLLPALGLSAQVITPDGAATLARWILSSWFGCGTGALALLGGALVSYRYLHNGLSTEGK